MRPLCVLGLGLIGGSVLRAATAAGIEAWAASAPGTDIEAASAEGFSVLEPSEALRAAAERDALICLAVPLPAVDEVLSNIAEHTSAPLLTDVVSVKQPVLDAVRRILPDARYVGGHPMAGKAESGWSASSAELFTGADWAVCLEPETELANWRTVCALALACGARVVPAGAAEHDRAVARISHLPHVFAEVLAELGARNGALPLRLAAGSFSDATRVAGTRPELVRAMCDGNAEALSEVLDSAIEALRGAREALGPVIESGHRGRTELDRLRSAPGTELSVDLTAPEAHAGLLAIGERGGVITAIDGEHAHALVP